MEKNKLEAESKLLCKKFGAESLGATWLAALLPEFKKPYVEEVLSMHVARWVIMAILMSACQLRR